MVNSQIGPEWYEQKCTIEYVKTCSENIFSATVHFPERETSAVRCFLHWAVCIVVTAAWGLLSTLAQETRQVRDWQWWYHLLEAFISASQSPWQLLSLCWQLPWLSSPAKETQGTSRPKPGDHLLSFLPRCLSPHPWVSVPWTISIIKSVCIFTWCHSKDGSKRQGVYSFCGYFSCQALKRLFKVTWL